MLRDCKRCAAIGLAVCACVVAGESIRATEEGPNLNGLVVAVGYGIPDSPHTESEIAAPYAAGLIGIRPGYTATTTGLHLVYGWRTPGWPRK